ncbi:hypothetical protein H920_16894 [Fukomys damarensis]|uniref:Uncharacterized protein n=1 Tax=Fukomys damarensis TaxID=885580 RepID=A0A091CTP0_FUKDA|nr:hypothetical protein H920_16894 [Fukomys damarensis]
MVPDGDNGLDLKLESPLDLAVRMPGKSFSCAVSGKNQTMGPSSLNSQALSWKHGWEVAGRGLWMCPRREERPGCCSSEGNRSPGSPTCRAVLPDSDTRPL